MNQEAKVPTVLIQHNRGTGHSDYNVFDGPNSRAEAWAERRRLERETASDPNIEVVTIHGRLEDVRITHSRYFYFEGSRNDVSHGRTWKATRLLSALWAG